MCRYCSVRVTIRQTVKTRQQRTPPPRRTRWNSPSPARPDPEGPSRKEGGADTVCESPLAAMMTTSYCQYISVISISGESITEMLTIGFQKCLLGTTWVKQGTKMSPNGPTRSSKGIPKTQVKRVRKSPLKSSKVY